MNVLIPAVVVLVVHEGGHIAVWLKYGIKPRKVVINGWRIGIMFNADSSLLSRRQKFYGALGGPAANILFGLIPINRTLSIMSILFGLFNLLPIKGSDGWKILNAKGGENA